MSMGLLGFQLDAIYHTSILLNGLEYVYDGGIVAIRPGSSHLGRPLQQIPLGKTELPVDVIEEYLDSLRGIYTVEVSVPGIAMRGPMFDTNRHKAYDLWRHNCNNFSNDFATFLVGKGIPGHIINMPQAVLDSPLGNMLLPALNQGVNANRRNGGILGIEADAQRNGTQSVQAPHLEGRVRNVTSAQELDALLAQANVSCAAIFFTSASCAPCKTLYALYDELASEVGDRGVLIKVDISEAYAIAARYSIRSTPTFVTFLKGKEETRWSGADPSTLRGNIQLLVHMSWPSHPHQSLNVPTFARANVKPVLFAKVPPLPKLLAKMGKVAEDPAVKGVANFVQGREKGDPADAHLPDVASFTRFLRNAPGVLPQEVMFTVVDLFRCALVDPRFSGCLAEEVDHQTVACLLQYVNGLSSCPYALRLVTLQMACNLFSSPLYPDQILESATLRTPITNLLSSSFLDDDRSNIRVAAASLLFNVSVANSARRNDGRGDGLPEGDQIELAASTLEAILQEEKSSEALEGMLLALGYLVYRLPLDGELADLLRTMVAEDTVLGKQKRFKDMRLITEVGSELLGKGLRKP